MKKGMLMKCAAGAMLMVAVVGAAMMPKKNTLGRKAGKLLKAAGDIAEDLAEALGL